MQPSISTIAIIIIACVVVAYLIHVCFFIRFKALGVTKSKGLRVSWIIAPLVLGPLVWPVWWLTHRIAAKTPSSVYSKEAFSISDPLISKPSAPPIDNDDDFMNTHANAPFSGGSAAAFAVAKPSAPLSGRFDDAAHAQAASHLPCGVAAGYAPAPEMSRVPDDLTDQ